MFVMNALLLVFGTIGALTAIGGVTWIQAECPIYRRITPRGWAAIACLLTTLGLGVAKEAVTHFKTLETEAKAQAAEQEAARARAEEKIARGRLDDMQGKVSQIDKNNTALLETNRELSAELNRVPKRRVASTSNGNLVYAVNKEIVTLNGCETMAVTLYPYWDRQDAPRFVRLNFGKCSATIMDMRSDKKEEWILPSPRQIVVPQNIQRANITVEADGDGFELGVSIEQIGN